ncbi:hypothetical protein IAD21_06425 (plasmid) [Abditibacteriota bacterium]|nr:hypothetical protein IAD21_06425 [Abditibacteriota bacterium]
MSAPHSDRNDELLVPFLQVPESEEEVLLEELLQRVECLLHTTVRRKVVCTGSPSDQEDELMAAIMLRIIEHLRRCKHSYVVGDQTVIIRHFLALCQAIASTTLNDYLRLKYPRRASVQNQLLYVIREIKDGNRQPLFALWRDAEERVCGFRAWQGSKVVVTHLHHLLEANPRLAMREALPAEDTKQLPLSRVLDSMLKWLGSPASFDTVVWAIMRWSGVEEQCEVSLFHPPGEEFMAREPVSPDLSPEERLLLNEYLRQLWRDITDLPPKHCAALLLHLRDSQGRGILSFLPILRIATFAQIAAAMDMELHQFAALWPRLPLDDHEIAALYGCGASSVSVWRMRARARLLKKGKEV